MPGGGCVQPEITMLHTVMPPECVWWDLADMPDAEVIAEGTRRIWVRQAPDGTRRVERLSSTEPRDYRDPRLQPGAIWRRPARSGPPR